MKYNFGFKVEHQLCKDNLTLILGREKEIQTYGQLNTTLAQMCPDLLTGPTDDMEQMTWLGMSEYLFRDLVDGVTAKRIISGNAQHLFYPLKLSSLFFLLARLFFIFLCIFCVCISLSIWFCIFLFTTCSWHLFETLPQDLHGHGNQRAYAIVFTDSSIHFKEKLYLYCWCFERFILWMKFTVR